jgi:hypothetical protein
LIFNFNFNKEDIRRGWQIFFNFHDIFDQEALCPPANLPTFLKKYYIRYKIEGVSLLLYKKYFIIFRLSVGRWAQSLLIEIIKQNEALVPT